MSRSRTSSRLKLERSRSVFFYPGFLGLLSDPQGHPAGDQSYKEHYSERNDVPGVGDSEGKTGRGEEEVECGDAQERSQQGRPFGCPAGGPPQRPKGTAWQYRQAQNREREDGNARAGGH